MEIFLRAAQLKLRFNSPKGVLTVEDLFDLPLTSTTGKANLDDIAKALYKSLKESSEVSFVEETPSENNTYSLALDIVKTVIQIKKDERLAATREAEKAATRQKIMALISQKSDIALAEKSIDDLQAMLQSL